MLLKPLSPKSLRLPKSIKCPFQTTDVCTPFFIVNTVLFVKCEAATEASMEVSVCDSSQSYYNSGPHDIFGSGGQPVAFWFFWNRSFDNGCCRNAALANAWHVATISRSVCSYDG